MISLARDASQKALIAAGLMYGKPLTGPYSVQIDITNRCNLDCIGCWCRSPLLKEKAMAEPNIRRQISLTKFNGIIKELASMGCREVYLTGGGEPSIHPDFLKIVRSIKSRGLRCDMSTNLTLFNLSMVERFVEVGVDHMNVSVWAGDERGYEDSHPNQAGRGMLARIKETLLSFDNEKRRRAKGRPWINMFNVISSMNHRDIGKMVEFAYSCHADSVDFVPIDTVPGKTDKLALKAGHAKWLIQEIERLRGQMRILESRYQHRLSLRNMDIFMERLGSDGLSHARYDGIVDTMPCYSGFAFARILADGTVIPCMKAHNYPLGNINTQSFGSIWHGWKHEIFRERSICRSKKDRYFYNMGNGEPGKSGCDKGCDNLQMNLNIHRKMRIPMALRGYR